jgi:cysteinyl-tRNA synthetase
VGLRIYDNLTRTLKEFVPIHPGKVGIYVCGMTVQGPPHVGHLRAAVVGDVIRRYLEHRGYEVTLVHNFTDVDDKIIARAAEEQVDYRLIADRNMRAYDDAIHLLNVLPPTVAPKASEHMEEIIGLISDLVEKGHAYAADGDVYFDVGSFPGYGRLSGRRVEELRAGSRIEVDEAKRNPEDFALWKGSKPGEPAWPSPWGDGRPGWHIECSAMAMRYLGPVLDLHGGGMDLLFPHHENELAQSEAATGQAFVHHWVQHGLVNLAGEKMSKSTQHFFLAEDVFREVDPGVVRYYLMTTHYRSPIEFSKERLAEAGTALGKLKNFLADADWLQGDAEKGDRSTGGRLAGAAGGGRAPAPTHPEVDQLVSAAEERFVAAMDEDFNTARAMATLFEMVREIGRLRTEEHQSGEAFGRSVRQAAGALRKLAGVLGLPLEAESESIPEAVESMRMERERARSARDWARADKIRDQLQSLGWAVEDHPGGSRLKKL